MEVLIPNIKKVWPRLLAEEICGCDPASEILRSAIQHAKDLGYTVELEKTDSPIDDLIRPLL